MIEPLKPHVYRSDTTAGAGDCKCGNVYDDPIHINSEVGMTSKVDRIASRLAKHRQHEQVIISDSLSRLLTSWDGLSAAIDRIVTALPAQMSEASNRLEAERKLMREEITAYAKAEGR